MIRAAVAADLPRILAILNEAIATTTARWTEEPETIAGLRAWFETAAAQGRAILAAEEGGELVGFGSLAAFRAFPGFRFTVEHSLYVDPRAKRRGFGRRLLQGLEERARAEGKHAIIGLVGADNEGSLHLHRAAGFVEVGRMPQAGFKFGRWLDLVLMQKML